MNILELKEVSFHYKKSRTHHVPKGVENISFQIPSGSSMGIIGESGSGKSTLLSLLLALRKPDSGNIFFNDNPIDIGSRPAELAFRSSIQAVFQDPYASLDPRQRIDNAISEPLRSLGITRNAREIAARVLLALTDVELESDIAMRFPHQLSGGQRQRVAIARALITSPALLVADEPTSALDVTTRIEIIDLLKKIRRERNFSLILVSHDISVVATLTDSIAVLKNGAIVEYAPTQQIVTSPQNEYTRRLIDAVPRLKKAR